MEKSNIKRDNQRALPKFFLVLLVCGIFGGVMGFVSAYADRHGLLEGTAAAMASLLTAVVPWGIPVTSLFLLGASLWQLRAAARLHGAWNGEDEDTVDAAEEKLSWVLLLTTVQILLDFLFFSLWVHYRGYGLPPLLVFVGGFLLSIGAVIVLQQKVIDLTRRINPEKRGSVYDMRFRKKWLESCDEAEQRQIGQAAYKSYSAVSVLCPALWCVLYFLDILFGTGPLPGVVVMLVWGVQQVTYVLECIRFQRKS